MTSGNEAVDIGETRPLSSPPHLSDEYHKARKQYALFSGLLIALTLVGIEIPEDVRLIESINIKLRSPDVLPLIMFTMVLYFAYRTGIEWYQCDLRRRSLIASKIDFRVANLLGALSIGTLAIDEAFKTPIGQFLAGVKLRFVVGVLSSFVFFPIGAFLRHLVERWRSNASVSLASFFLPSRRKSIAVNLYLILFPVSFLSAIMLGVVAYISYDHVSYELIQAFVGLISIVIGSIMPTSVRHFLIRPFIREAMRRPKEGKDFSAMSFPTKTH